MCYCRRLLGKYPAAGIEKTFDFSAAWTQDVLPLVVDCLQFQFFTFNLWRIFMKIVGKFGLVRLVGLGLIVGGCASPDSLAVADPAEPPAGLPPRPADNVIAAAPAVEWANNYSASAVVLPQADRKQQFTAELQLQSTDKSDRKSVV